MKKLSALLMLFVMVASMSVFAQDAAPEIESQDDKCALIPAVELSLDIKSKYMCDGEVVNPDGMLFLDAWAGWDCGLWVDVWSAIDLNGFNNGSDDFGPYKNDRRNRPEEIDYCVGYSYTFDDLLAVSPLTLGVTYLYFQYPRANFHSDENFDFSAILGNLLDKESDAWLSFGFVWRYNTKKYTNKSWFDLTYGYNFTDKFSAFISNKVFYVCKSKTAKPDPISWGLNRDAFSTLETTIEADYAVTDNFTVRAYVDCGWGLDHEYRAAMKASPTNNSFNVRYGAGCSYAF